MLFSNVAAELAGGRKALVPNEAARARARGVGDDALAVAEEVGGGDACRAANTWCTSTECSAPRRDTEARWWRLGGLLRRRRRWSRSRRCPSRRTRLSSLGGCGHPRLDWASLLRKTFGFEVLHCPCGARRQVLAAVTDWQHIDEELRKRGLEPTLRAMAGGRMGVIGVLSTPRSKIPGVSPESGERTPDAGGLSRSVSRGYS